MADTEFIANYDESKVPVYTLPDPLVSLSGEPVKDALQWASRRAEILSLFETHVYGKTPADLRPVRVTLLADDSVLNGKARRKQVRLSFTEDDARPYVDLMLYVPVDREQPAPAFVGLSFFGNHTIESDPVIVLSDAWMRKNDDYGIVDNRATEATRGVCAHRWPVEMIVDRGYALATAYCGDLDPDFDDGFQNGVHPLFYCGGQMRPEPDEWGTIGAWAWGLSRALDYLETDPDVDAARAAVMGHSRLGKTSLWAAAQDTRFALAISNDSGCGGAALSRRAFGETVGRINRSFPHWFCENHRQYNENEAALPVDQHMLIALMAPRPVYVASAEEDRWADPVGEFQGARHADPVYRLLGAGGLEAESMPGLHEPVTGTIGYHIRAGGHGVTDYDWARYLDFADLHLARR